MSFRPSFQLNNSYYLFLLVRQHGKRLGDLSDFHVIYHLTDFLWKFLHLELRGSHIAALVILVYHQTLIITCILVVRDECSGFLKRELIRLQIIVQ